MVCLVQSHWGIQVEAKIRCIKSKKKKGKEREATGSQVDRDATTDNDSWDTSQIPPVIKVYRRKDPTPNLLSIFFSL